MRASLFCIGLALVQGQDYPAYTEINPFIPYYKRNQLTDIVVNSQFGKLVKIGVPVIVRDLYKLYVYEPPHEVNNGFELKHGSVQDVVDNFINCRISTCTPEQYEHFTCACDDTFRDLSAVENKGLYSQVAVAANIKLKKLVVSYRGTTNFQNVLNDGEYQLIDVPSLPNGVRVHRGFYSYHLSLYYSAQELLKRLLIKPEYKDYTIQLTGYSLGAAVAIISIPDWMNFLKEQNSSHPLEVYTYAGPRSGNHAFANYINQFRIPITRYTNINDIVPQTPPRSGEFSHTGVEVHQESNEILEDGNFNFTVCITKYDEDSRCSLKWRNSLSGRRHFTPFGAPNTKPIFC